MTAATTTADAVREVSIPPNDLRGLLGLPAGARGLGLFAHGSGSGRLSPRSLAIAAVVQDVAREMQRSPAQVALAWTLLHRAVASPILGVRTLAQLQDNLGALELDFSPEQRRQLDEVSRIDLGFPHEFLASPAMGPMLGNVKCEPR